MKQYNTLAFALGILFLLPGCGGNIKDWADETFYQGKNHNDYEKTVKPFLKGIRLYDQFDTLAIFDALWLSDTARTAYAQMYAKMTGKCEDAYIDFLRRELSANTYFVSFYVLSPHSIALTDLPPLWAVHAEIDGKKYLPVEIKLVELSAEYTGFFGKRINNHKDAYEIRFDRKDSDGHDILEDKQEIKLFFSNPRFYGVMSWKIGEDNKIELPAFVSTTALEQKEESAPSLATLTTKKTVREHRSVHHDQQALPVAGKDVDQSSINEKTIEIASKEPSMYDIEGSVPIEDAVKSTTGSLGEFGGGGGGGFVDGIE